MTFGVENINALSRVLFLSMTMDYSVTCYELTKMTLCGIEKSGGYLDLLVGLF